MPEILVTGCTATCSVFLRKMNMNIKIDQSTEGNKMWLQT